MTEQVNKPGDGGGAAIDMTKFVSKDDYDKVSTQQKDLESKLKDAAGALDQAKLSLLDPDYIQFLESKKGRKMVNEISNKDLEGKTPKEIVDLTISRVKEELLPDYERALTGLSSTLTDVLAVLELQEVEKTATKAGENFDDYREDVTKILQSSSTPLTIAQAYSLAKYNRKDAESTKKDDKTKEKEAKMHVEKPSGRVMVETPKKTYGTSKAEAAKASSDAWDEVIGEGKETL